MKNFCFLLCLVIVSCQQSKVQNKVAEQIAAPSDPHSYSRPEQALVKHLDLQLNVNFGSKTIDGKAEWQIDNPAKADTIVFDTRQLKIIKVTVGDAQKRASFNLSKEDPVLGQALKVKIDSTVKKVTIWYRTSPDAYALQWLNPAQTAGKKHPFLFTQSQAILARTWIPCQDSPGIRFTYNAAVKVPGSLLALMSAENPQQLSADGKYTFKQSNPIPAYLMALAVGNIRFKAIDARTGVYAEPQTLEKAAYEFADMGKMVNAAESLYGPYRWGRYDVLVPPPSFPFGGMENPMLTFATPTVLAGDRSLVSLIAHELAHSWSGNLVTNATWNDFWLNEGFTTYIERRIIEAVYGKEEAAMQIVLGARYLNETIERMGNQRDLTRLKLDLKGKDPDDGMNDIAYEKGFFFLKTVENAVGREEFDAFLKAYFEQNAFKSITTERFISYLDRNLLSRQPKLRADIKTGDWVYKAGLPSNMPVVSSEKLDKVDTLVNGLSKGVKFSDIKKQISSLNEKVYFIKSLPDSITAQQMKDIDRLFAFTESTNSEIQFEWYMLALKHDYKAAHPYIEKFISSVGRRKFVIPLYTQMASTPQGKLWAARIYAKARPGYHPVAYQTIDEILK